MFFTMSCDCENNNVRFNPDTETANRDQKTNGFFSPLVTIVTVVYNDEKNIEKTIQSIINQRYKNIEYIVIDGGSKDGTVEIINKYIEFINYFISETDSGIYDAMNKAIDLASGDWINFMNSNDWFCDEKVLTKVFSDYPDNADFIYGHSIWKGEKKEIKDYARPLETMWQRICFTHQSLFVRTSLMQTCKFDTSFEIVSDYHFYFTRYINGYNFHNSNIFIATVSAGGLSHNQLWKRTKERWGIVRNHHNKLKVDAYYLFFVLKVILFPYAVNQLFKRKRNFHKDINNKIPKKQNSKCSFSSNKPVVSVIVANFNNAEYIEDCFESILAQTYPNIEVVIADDCSTDNSIDIIEQNCKKYLTFLVIKNSDNIGVARNRHNAIISSHGEFIMTLDSDDYLLDKDKILKEIDLFYYYKKKFNKDILPFSNITLVNKNKEFIQKAGNKKNIKQGNIFSSIITRDCMIPRDFVMSRQQYLSVGGYDHQIPIYEDWDLKIRLAVKYEYHYTGLDGISYRRHGEGLSAVSLKDHMQWISTIFYKNYHLTDVDYKFQVANNFDKLLRKMKKFEQTGFYKHKIRQSLKDKKRLLALRYLYAMLIKERRIGGLDTLKLFFQKDEE